MIPIAPNNLLKIDDPHNLEKVIADYQKIITQVAQATLHSYPEEAHLLKSYSQELGQAKNLQNATPPNR